MTNRTLVALLALYPITFALGSAFGRGSGQEPMNVKPGKPHELLEKFVGTWNGKGMITPDPKQPSIRFQSLQNNDRVCNDLWLHSRLTATGVGEGPLEAFRLIGYDDRNERYVSIWIDSLGSDPFIGVGHLSEDGRQLTFQTYGDSRWTGKMIEQRSVITFVSAEKRKTEFFQRDVEGEWRLFMEVTEDRRM